MKQKIMTSYEIQSLHYPKKSPQHETWQTPFVGQHVRRNRFYVYYCAVPVGGMQREQKIGRFYRKLTQNVCGIVQYTS